MIISIANNLYKYKSVSIEKYYEIGFIDIDNIAISKFTEKQIK